MSKLAEYRQLERHLAEQLSALETLKGEKGLEQDIEFEAELRVLRASTTKAGKTSLPFWIRRVASSPAVSPPLLQRPLVKLVR